MAWLNYCTNQLKQEGFAPTTAILETEHLSREVGGVRIGDNVTVKVHSGELPVVVGPSGAGKSSFLRLLNRLDEPTGGTVRLGGIDYRQIPPQELRRRVGMVTQTAYLFPGTIADNFRFGPGQQGIELPAETIATLLMQVGLEGRAGEDVAHLSGGEAQRLSLARALANSPEVLLLDEPTSALATKRAHLHHGLARPGASGTHRRPSYGAEQGQARENRNRKRGDRC